MKNALAARMDAALKYAGLYIGVLPENEAQSRLRPKFTHRSKTEPGM